MKLLLRSVIVIPPNDDEDQTFRNFLGLQISGLGFDVAEYEIIWQYILEFAKIHHHCPNISTLRSHFDHTKQNEVLDCLELLSGSPAIYRGDFIRRLEERVEDRRTRGVGDILREAVQILQTGIEIKNGKEKKLLKGPMSAIHYITDKAHEIVAPALGGRLSGEALSDTKGFKEEVESAELSGRKTGQHTGIKQMDNTLNGAWPKELWTHAAFTGGLKSTLMLNWAYNQAVYLGYDSCIFSLEMPYEQDRRILYAMHTMNGKFKDVRKKLGIQVGEVDVGLDYEKIRDGVLTQNEKAFLFEWVIPDLDTGKYGKIHIEVADPNKSDFTVADLQSKAELIYAKNPYKIIFVDHTGLMAPRKWVPSTTERLNEIIRDLKRLSLSFNRGEGIAVVNLFQINREGYKAAEKNEGKYNLTHLSYANECERSSDVVTASWVDDNLRKQNRVAFQCLKTRDRKPFERFFSRVEWPCRRILTSDDMPLQPGDKKKVGDKIDSMSIDTLMA